MNRSLKRIGFIGWRGMVGSVLMERMRAENDFQGFAPLFASTSQVGQRGPDVGLDTPPLRDAFDIDTLGEMDAIVTCQGSGYTKKVYPDLRAAGWKGYWIDAASALRMEEDAVIILDPVNRQVIDKAVAAGVKDFIGGNCTVSLMLMGVSGLFAAGLVEWLTSMTYQAASGAGAENMRELVAQMACIGDASKGLLDPNASILDLDRRVIETMNGPDFPTENFTVPLAANNLPWIDSPMDSGQSREEWKGFAETNKILGTKKPVPVDGICVRVGAMRCHSQAFTIKLTRDVGVDELAGMIGEAHEWVSVVPNTKEATLANLTPAAVSGTLDVPVGRLRKMNLGPTYLAAFTVGDQLLWGAAEPLRRMLRIVREQ